MAHYVGLDVSLKQTSICVVNQAGSVVREGVVDSDPELMAAFVRSKAPGALRIGLETGPTTTWLWTELRRLGLPVICIDARHAKAVLNMQINKSDRNDAAGIARIMQTGWFKEVRVKDIDSHLVKALLVSRALLVKIKRDLENQIRGLLKNLGLVVGRAKFNVFAVRTEELIEDRPELAAVIRPLLAARKAIEEQIGNLERKVLKLARHDMQVRSFMTVPGVGPVTALCFKATIDDPTRFKRSRSVGAYGRDAVHESAVEVEQERGCGIGHSGDLPKKPAGAPWQSQAAPRRAAHIAARSRTHNAPDTSRTRSPTGSRTRAGACRRSAGIWRQATDMRSRSTTRSPARREFRSSVRP